MGKEWIVILSTAALSFYIVGCASTSHVGEHFSMSGTPDGIRAFSDTLIGSMKTAKEGADVPNQYFGHRGEFERNITARGSAQPKGFLQKLFAQSPEQGGQS